MKYFILLASLLLVSCQPQVIVIHTTSEPIVTQVRDTVYIDLAGDQSNILEQSDQQIAPLKENVNQPAKKVEKKTVKKTEKKAVKKEVQQVTRCQATTKKGTQCSRNAQPGSSYCWQH